MGNGGGGLSLVRIGLVCLGLLGGTAIWGCPELSALGFSTRVAVDRRGERIAGRVRWAQGAVWLDVEWNEPLLLAAGNPLRLSDGVELSDGFIWLHHVQME